MKRSLSFGFLLMGFGFTVTQGLLIRELLVAFFGNELSIGLVLGSWLVLEAIGSGLLGRLADRWGKKASSFAVLQVAFALFLPVCLYGAYTSRSLLGAIPGEGIGLIPIAYASFLILAPLGLVDGAMFAFGCRAYAHLTNQEVPSIGRVYVLEAVGGIAGGILFTYLFIPLLRSVQISLLLSALNLLSAALLLATSRPRQRLLPWLVASLVLMIAAVGLLLSPLSETLHHWLTEQQWAGYDLVYSENSVYGNVAVVQREEQFTFYADGMPLLTAPVPDVALSEEIVHLPLLFVADPRRALVLSGGVGGVLHELGKYPLDQIEYAELDPLLIEAVRRFPTPLTQSELGDPRLQIQLVDGRLLVRQRWQERMTHAQARYDLIVLNLPYPATLQLNRFYTVEFLRMLRGLLAEDGVLVLSVPGSLSYMDQGLRNLNLMVYDTLQAAFPFIRPIPGDQTLWLASPSEGLLVGDVEVLVDRWEERGLETDLLTPFHIRLRLDQRYVDWFWMSLSAVGGEGQGGLSDPARGFANRDLDPVGLFYGLSYWNALFSPGLARVFGTLGRLKLGVVALPLAGCALLFLAVGLLTGRGRRAAVPIAIAATGFAGMTADLVIIFAFQTLYGYVFQWIGLLITAFMAGLSLGGLLMTRRLARTGGALRTLLWLEAGLLLFWALLPAALKGLYGGMDHPLVSGSLQALLLFLNALAGFLVGSQFPLANRIWLEGRKSQGEAVGMLYACDLIGAFLGSILVSVVLIPVLGIVETCLLVAILKGVSLVLMLVLAPRS
jgi:spermidine synthase